MCCYCRVGVRYNDTPSSVVSVSDTMTRLQYEVLKCRCYIGPWLLLNNRNRTIHRFCTKFSGSKSIIINLLAELKTRQTLTTQKCKTTSFKKEENQIIFSFIGLMVISQSSDKLKCDNLTTCNNLQHLKPPPQNHTKINIYNEHLIAFHQSGANHKHTNVKHSIQLLMISLHIFF